MTIQETSSGDVHPNRIRHYAEVLNPLFWDDQFNDAHRLFEWACTMLRVAGIRDIGWDSYIESIALLSDLTKLMNMELPCDRFSHPDSTQVRLAVIAYSHMIEMSVPYEFLANLLRLRLGMKYAIAPLAHLNKVKTQKINGMKVNTIKAAYPFAKINEIDRLATRAGMPKVGNALRGIYNATIRNAVAHSDFAVHDGTFRLLSGHVYSRRQGVYTSLLSFDELGELTSEAFAFHSALYQLWTRQRKLFIDFKNKILPYDDHYKGIIEYTFEDDSLNGFRVYWPNGTVGICARNADGSSMAQNIRFDPDGSVNFFVGVLATTPGPFSPCVEDGTEPLYAKVPGTDKRPHWPVDLRPYAI